MAYQSTASDRPALPEYLARKGEGAMDDEDFAAVVKGALAQSVQFIDTEMSVERAKATEYYLGKPFGTEEEGRSQVVMTEVRDAVDGMLPSLLRVFFGSEHAVEFVPSRADTVEQAAQQTDYVRYVFEEDNAGFLRALDVLKDGLIRKIGIFKWAWDTSVSVKAIRMEGIDDDTLNVLGADETVTLTRVTKRKPVAGETAGEKGAPAGPVLYDVDLTRTTKDGRARVWAVPPEEFLYNRQARSLDEALLIAHRTDKTRGELLALGISEEDIDEHAGAASQTTDVTLKGNAEEIARRDVAGVGRVSGFGYTTDPDLGTANQKILYTDALMRIDANGDGIPELLRVCCIGPTYHPVKHYPADDSMGFSIFTPYPEPHTLVGGSVADRTMDIQRITSSLLRSILDSLSASIFPRTVYLEGGASPADVMNTAIGAPIRERVLNAVRTLEMPFVGKEAMPLIDMMRDTVERRTGRNKGVAGLEADALQSTGKEAVGAVLTGSQEQLEMVARVFAEMTLKRLFSGLGKLLQTHQPRERVVRLRGKWVPIDPRTWDSAMDVTVNVGLGTTFTDKKIAILMGVAADQKDLAMATGGLSSPVVPLPKIMSTRAKLLALHGIKDADSYYTLLPPDWQPPPPPPTPPDPEQGWIMAEKEMNHIKTMKELAIKADELALKREQAAHDAAQASRETELRFALDKYKADLQFAGAKTQAELDRALESDVHETQLALDAHDQLHTHALARDAHQHDQAMDVRAADLADEQAAQQAAQQAAAQRSTESGGDA